MNSESRRLIGVMQSCIKNLNRFNFNNMNEVYPIPGFAEPVSSWTHLAAAGVLFFLSISLLRQGTSAGQIISLFVFAFSCVFLLSMSGVYHLLPKSGAGSLVLRRLDHAAIFVLIAGQKL